MAISIECILKRESRAGDALLAAAAAIDQFYLKNPDHNGAPHISVEGTLSGVKFCVAANPPVAAFELKEVANG